MKKIELIRMLEKYPLFTFNEFVRITGKSSEYARTYLYRLKKEGLVFSVERGKYTVFDDAMLFSSYISVPSYISFWTGLVFHNMTEQLPVEITVAVAKSKENIVFKGTKVRFFKTKQIWGYRKYRYRGFDIFVAEKEKCIIDSLLLKNVPFDEIVKSIRTKEFDADKLSEYAVKTGNKSLMKRVGYIMDKCGMNSAADRLTKYTDNNYVLLDWSATGKWKINKKSWKSNRRRERFPSVLSDEENLSCNQKSLKSARRNKGFPSFLIAEEKLSCNQKFKIVENRRLDVID